MPKKLFLNELNDYIQKDIEQNYFCFENLSTYYLIPFKTLYIFDDSTYCLGVEKSCKLIEKDENFRKSLISDFHSKNSNKLETIEKDLLDYNSLKFRYYIIDLLQNIELKDGKKYNHVTIVLTLYLDTRTKGLECPTYYSETDEFEMLSELDAEDFVFLPPIYLGPKTAETED